MVTFGDIRSLCENTPSRETFHILLECLNEASHSHPQEQIQQEWFPYIEQKLDHWPAHNRSCPRQALQELEEGEFFCTPLIKSLDYTEDKIDQKRIDRLLAASHLEHITHLDLGACRRLKWPPLLKLAQNAPFSCLTAFAFCRNTKEAEKAELAEFFSSPMLANVDTLSFADWNSIKAFTLDVLAKSFSIEQLKHLDLTGCSLSRKRLQTLFDTGRLYGLETLILEKGGHDVDFAHAITDLANDSNFTSIKTLRVSGVTNTDMKALAQASHLSSLERLSIEMPTAEDELPSLLGSSTIKNLEHLSIITFNGDALSEAVTRLAHNQDVQTLRHLVLQGEGLHQDAIAELVASQVMANLESLTINQCNTPNLGKLLGESASTTRLIHLNLSTTQLSSKSVCTLASSNNLTALRSLDLSYNAGFTDEAFEALGNASFLDQLSYLNLNVTRPTQLQLTRLLSGLTNARLGELGLIACHMMASEFDVLMQCNALKELHTLRITPKHQTTSEMELLKELIDKSPHLNPKRVLSR